jgi:hypothetical protein
MGLILFFNLSNNITGHAATNGDYRSALSGSWSSAATWEKFNGTSWAAASSPPSSSDGVIEIQAGHVVTINSGINADQVIVNSGGVLNHISGTCTFNNGAGDELTINGTFNVNGGTLTVPSGASIITNGQLILTSGTMTINSSSTIDVNDGGIFTRTGGTLTLGAGPLRVNSGGTYRHNMNGNNLPLATWNTNSTVEVNGITNTVPGNLNQQFYNFKWNCISQVANLNFSGNLTTINGTLTIASTGTNYVKLKDGTNTINISGSYVQTGGTLYLTASNNAIGTLNVAGDFSQSGGSFCSGLGNNNTASVNVVGSWNLSGGTFAVAGGGSAGTNIVFNQPGIQNFNATGSIFTGNINYTVNSGTTLNLGSGILSGSGSFTLNSGAGLMINSALGISASGATGNIQVTGTRTFSSGANYIFNGSTTQITGNGLPSTINNLTINNSYGVTLSGNVTVSGILTFDNGIITTGSYEVKTSNTSPTAIIGYSSSKYVAGYLRRTVSANGSYDFPVGTALNYELVNVTLSSMTGFTEILSYFTNGIPVTAASPLSGISVDGTSITEMLDYGFWTLTPNSSMTGGTYSVTLNSKGHTNPAGDANAYTVLKRENASMPWQSLGTHNNSTQSESNGVAVATRTGLTSFSQFGIGKGTGPLPIELVYFNIRPEGSIVKCLWQTASEVNNDFFIIERSLDGINFTSIGKIDGAGNSSSTLSYSFNDESPSKGISFYRLKQTDYDGRFTYSKIKSVTFSVLKPGETLTISSVAPNPFRENFSVSYSIEQDAEVDIVIMNANEQPVYSEKYSAEKGNNRFYFSEGYNLPNGIYFIRISSEDKVQIKKIIKN